MRIPSWPGGRKGSQIDRPDTLWQTEEPDLKDGTCGDGAGHTHFFATGGGLRGGRELRHDPVRDQVSGLEVAEKRGADLLGFAAF